MPVCYSCVMSQKFAAFVFVLFAGVFGLFGYFITKSGTSIEDVAARVVAPQDQTAGTFFQDSITEVNLHNRYRKVVAFAESGDRAPSYKSNKNQPIKILIVPGHDNHSKGTHFDGFDEVEFNRIVADYLYDFLKEEPAFEVMRAHENGEYTSELQEYFEEEKESIAEFRNEYKKQMDDLIKEGKVTTHSGVDHNFAASEVALRLYGINKWANEQGVDLVVHVHFNDYPGRKWNQSGKYSGFAIYVPEKQFSNARVSHQFADYIYNRLSMFWSQSDLPAEREGVIEDQELIAIGSFNTLDAASVLIEYGYIYEGRFQEPDVSDAMFKELAFQTYVGIKSFFEKGIESSFATSLIPYKWSKDVVAEGSYSADILSLQAHLSLLGYYPPTGKDSTNCPLTGFLGDCTKDALQAFQEDKNILPANGFFGPKTREVLNNLVVE